MKRAVAERKLYRRNFTISANKLTELQKCAESADAITAEFKMLRQCYEDLCTAQNKVINIWLDDEARDESLMEKDMDTANDYSSRWYALETQVNKSGAIVGSPTNSRNGTVIDNKSIDSAAQGRHHRLPKLELPTFNGEIKGWIAFWTQFKKIHHDAMIDNDDKFQYLLQCMEPGSNARELVESFPPCGKNYERVVEQLKQRFAKDELIIEHYVRELLQLVLAQAKGTLKTSIRSLYDKITTQILALESMGVTQDKYAAFLYPLVESALPEELLRAWHRSHFHSESETNSLTKLLQFVKQEVLSDERVRLARSFSTDAKTPALPSTSCLATTDKQNMRQSEMNIKQCLFCDKTNHTSSECVTAVDKTLDERREIVKRKKACGICLNVGHYWKSCKRHIKCVICSKRHYPIMCQHKGKPVEDKVTKQLEAVSINQLTTNKTVLLQTLRVKIGTDTESTVVRVLLDSGAQRSFIKAEVARKLTLKPTGQQELSHNLFGGAVLKKQTHNLYNITLSSLDGSYTCTLNALEQNVICGYLPQLRAGKLLAQLESLGISLTDCTDNTSEIGMLIGSDVLGSLLTGRSVRVDENLLAMETKLGWTVQGPAVDVYCTTVNTVSTIHCSIEDFWDLETLGIKDDATVANKKMAEAKVMSFFEDTVRVRQDNRYEVRLPWKGTSKTLQPNFNVALKRLYSTTAHVTKLGILKDYDTVFQEWLNDGIIEVVDVNNTSTGYYLPHHAVVKESSLTTKIRPVFDASSKDKNGLSLNSCLEKGINLIELIPKLLINFRRNAIGVTADIKKAFLQIGLHPDDRDYLKFLWWENVDGQGRVLKTFRHQRVVFGVTTSPFLLSATILFHLNKYKSKTATILKQSFYVDNCVVSVKNENEMNKFIAEAKNILVEGQFELRCWVTGPILTDKEIKVLSVLGLLWDPRQDVLYCKMPSVKLNQEIFTKRNVLSLAQSIFDPLGFVAPVALVPKLVLQKSWILNKDWDQPLPQDLTKTMSAWLQEMKELESCKIPRRISTYDVDESENSLHIFCDASLLAYACCIFLRSESNNSVDVQLVLAKSRVAPTKHVTMPRLELMAALLATRLMSQVREGLDLNCKEYYWSDSSIVIAWLKRKDDLNVFVRNRVTEILQRTNIDAWRHVPGDKNPADLPSRGCNPARLLQTQWWTGPDWLRKQTKEWPVLVEPPDEKEVLREVKRSCTVVSDANTEPFSGCLGYFGKYTKLIRMIGWCHRFHNNSRKGCTRRQGDLTAEEYITAEKGLLRLLQREDEDAIIAKAQTFRDNDGLLRVKTRLTLSDDSDHFVNPIALLATNIIVQRLVLQEHVKLMHAGSQTLISNLRENYWIVGIRRLAKKIVKSCVRCKRQNAKQCSTTPAPLPFDRVHCGAAFEVTGVDLAGPLLLRSRQKCWVVLFTCAVYRAIHLELTTSLSSEDFMLALRRFLARRGNVRVIYSDNGTNFHGACNVFNNLDPNTLDPKITWRFIPPSAPWWGGFWERMVRTVKEILRRSLGKAALSETEFYTVLCETEKVINSRPLTYIAEDTENLRPLTPSMFLNMGCSDRGVDNIDQVDGNILSSRWRHLNTIKVHIKERFRKEYLSLLTQRSAETTSDIQVGDVVLIGSDDSKRVNWPLGLVLELMPGVDGHSRVARLRTAAGERIRALQRIYRLEVGAHFDVEGAAKIIRTRSGRTVKVPQRLGF